MDIKENRDCARISLLHNANIITAAGSRKVCHLVHRGGVAEERVWDGKHISSGEVGCDGQVVDSHTHRASSTVHQHTGTAEGEVTFMFSLVVGG